jgi:hypothetical protein
MRSFVSCAIHKAGFLAGQRVGTLLGVRAVELGAVLASLVAAMVVVRLSMLRRRSVPAAVARLARAIPDALGDAVVLVDRAGRIAFANPAAARLAGKSVGELLDREVAELAPDLEALTRGLERAPSCARITVPTPRGPIRVRAALVRISARPPLALAVLRRLPRPAPPPLPAARLPAQQRADIGPGVDAAAAALREPIVQAAQAVSILRLAAPRLAARADGALAAAETALEVAAHRVAALAAAGHGSSARRPLDLAAIVEDLAAALAPPPGVRLRLELIGARALAEDRPVRAALRELLAGAVASLPAGGEITVALRAGSVAAIVEIRGGGAFPAGGLALARALVAAQGGRVEEESVPGRGSLVRLALEPAALEPA